ncbi:MAG: ABC transporter ATP-binding protein [Candidatus Nanohalarchaeota archaeon]|nr:MAG: ABC transporter ATP-binding protein [Candidatus Nanohaloarchaeota archaeon]
MEKPKDDARKKDEALVVLKDVWKIYQVGEVEVPALRGVSVEIKKGDFVAIVGASGSGKSTMMNLVGCLDTPSKGKIFLKSRNIADLCESDLATLRGKTIGFIFQQYNLLPNMTAYENVVLPLELQEVDDGAAAKQAKKVLKLVGLEDKMHHLPSQLSGGQQQRVAIARCLVGDPEIILADEPTGALDSVTGKDVLNMLERIWKEEGKTVIMVTHDLHLAEYAHNIIELKDGKIIRMEQNHVK